MSTRPDEPTWFDEPREWSRWKHFILERYLGRFAGILSHDFPLLYYVDGFAGAGLIGSGESRISGSPVLAAELAQRIAAKPPGSGTTLRCINIEQDRAIFQQLVQNTAAYRPDLVQNLQGTFADQLDTILAQIRGAPTLFFLDPFGFRGAELDVLTRLGNRPHRAVTELLVYYSPTAVRRVAGFLGRPDDARTPAMLRSLDRNFGTPTWRVVYGRFSEPEARDRHLLQLYQQQLAQVLGGSAFSYAVRSIQGQIKYFLVYFTRHPKGIRTLSEVLFDAQRAYDAEFVGVNLPLFGGTSGLAGDDVDIERLAAAIYQLGLQHPGSTFGQIQEQVAASDEWFGRVKTRQCRRACQRLIAVGRIQRASGTGIKEGEVLVFVQQPAP